MNQIKIHVLFIAFLFPIMLNAQQFPKYYQSNIITVYDSLNNLIPNPFGGGLKFPVFSSYDLNADGRDDLVLLDKVDNRVLTYVSTGDINYVYRPEYEKFFPDSLSSFLLLIDYNGDNKKDIFTFSKDAGAGIAVYKNISNELDGIKFKLESKQLQTYAWGDYRWSYNLPMFYIDIPCFVDVDKDGDLDVLLFDELGGSWLKLYNNMSMELIGTADSLWFTCIDE